MSSKKDLKRLDDIPRIIYLIGDGLGNESRMRITRPGIPVNRLLDTLNELRTCESAYFQIDPGFKTENPDAFFAFAAGEWTDFDVNPLQLAKRVRNQFPNQVLYIRQVGVKSPNLK